MIIKSHIPNHGADDLGFIGENEKGSIHIPSDSDLTNRLGDDWRFGLVLEYRPFTELDLSFRLRSSEWGTTEGKKKRLFLRE